MIDPKNFLSSKQEVVEEVVDSDNEIIEGIYSCPEQGCYSTSQQAVFNKKNRIITWVCESGHSGKATT